MKPKAITFDFWGAVEWLKKTGVRAVKLELSGLRGEEELEALYTNPFFAPVSPEVREALEREARRLLEARGLADPNDPDDPDDLDEKLGHKGVFELDLELGSLSLTVTRLYPEPVQIVLDVQAEVKDYLFLRLPAELRFRVEGHRVSLDQYQVKQYRVFLEGDPLPEELRKALEEELPEHLEYAVDEVALGDEEVERVEDVTVHFAEGILRPREYLARLTGWVEGEAEVVLKERRWREDESMGVIFTEDLEDYLRKRVLEEVAEV